MPDAAPRPPQNPTDRPQTASPPRFCWPMRLFLGFLVFDMIFHSFAALTPHEDWCKDLGVDVDPAARLPTADECRALAKKTSDDNPDPVGDRVWGAIDSVWDFFKPWPSAATRHKLRRWDDGGLYAFCWLKTRLNFLNTLIRFDQTWTMFSPNVAKQGTSIRVELEFQDGRWEIVENIAFPEDLTRYPSLRFLSEKVLQYQTKLSRENKDYRLGFCNFLVHLRPQNDQGSPLKTIYFYQRKVVYLKPGEDAMECLRGQSSPAAWDGIKPFSKYDVKSQTLDE